MTGPARVGYVITTEQHGRLIKIVTLSAFRVIGKHRDLIARERVRRSAIGGEPVETYAHRWGIPHIRRDQLLRIRARMQR